MALKLANAGHDVVRVGDGEAALAAAERERPDVIILDVMMPLMDGFAVLGRLKADPARRAIPVIMLTAPVAGTRRIRIDEPAPTAKNPALDTRRRPAPQCVIR